MSENIQKKKEKCLGTPTCRDLEEKDRPAKRTERVWPVSYEENYVPRQDNSLPGLLPASDGAW